MGSTNKFASGLNNWGEDDRPTREDFNRDNEILQQNSMWKKEYDNDSAVKTAGGIAPYVQKQAVVTGNTIPAGMMAPFGGTTAPAGWLLCQGQAVSRTTYADLFAALGTGFGAGNGSTTFNLPDMRGRFAMGVSGNYARASKSGRETVAANDLPIHHHYIPALSGTAHSGGNHFHYFKSRVNGAVYTALGADSGVFSSAFGARLWANDGDSYKLHVSDQQNDGAHSHSVTTNATNTGNVGAVASMNILNPYLAVNYIIKH